MKPTKPKKVFLIVFLSGWLVGATSYSFKQLFQIFVEVPINLVFVTYSLALAIVVWSVLARKRIKGPAKTLTAVQSARTAALALAGSHAGAALMGGSMGMLVSYLFTSMTPANQDRIQILLATAIGALFLIAASLWLERICLVPDKKDNP